MTPHSLEASTPLLIESSHRIKVIFSIFILFSHDESTVFVLLPFYFWFIIWFVMLFWKELSGIFLWLIDEQIAYWSLKCCLVVLDSLMYIRRPVLPQRRTIRFRIQFFSSAFFQQNLKLDKSWLQHQDCHQFHQVSTTLITSSEWCPYYISSL